MREISALEDSSDILWVLCFLNGSDKKGRELAGVMKIIPLAIIRPATEK
jgi:hypothetical protein